MFRNYARIPRPTFPLITVLIYIVNLGIHNAIYLKVSETLHGNTTNYPSLLMGDANNIRIRHTPNSPPPPRRSIVFHRKSLLKTVKVTLERLSNIHCYQFHIKQKGDHIMKVFHTYIWRTPVCLLLCQNNNNFPLRRVRLYYCIRVVYLTRYPNEYLPIIDLFNMNNCMNNILGWGMSLLLHIMINTSW